MLNNDKRRFDLDDQSLVGSSGSFGSLDSAC